MSRINGTPATIETPNTPATQQPAVDWTAVARDAYAGARKLPTIVQVIIGLGLVLGLWRGWSWMSGPVQPTQQVLTIPAAGQLPAMSPYHTPGGQYLPNGMNGGMGSNGGNPKKVLTGRSQSINMLVASVGRVGQRVMLNSSPSYKAQDNFTIVLEGVATQLPVESFIGKRVEATGEQAYYEGKPQVIVTHPGGIRIAGGAEPAAVTPQQAMPVGPAAIVGGVR
jgi:hypothetical protein